MTSSRPLCQQGPNKVGVGFSNKKTDQRLTTRSRRCSESYLALSRKNSFRFADSTTKKKSLPDVREDVVWIVLGLEAEEVADVGVRCPQLLGRVVRTVRQVEGACTRKTRLGFPFRYRSDGYSCLYVLIPKAAGVTRSLRSPAAVRREIKLLVLNMLAHRNNVRRKLSKKSFLVRRKARSKHSSSKTES